MFWLYNTLIAVAVGAIGVVMTTYLINESRNRNGYEHVAYVPSQPPSSPRDSDRRRKTSKTSSVKDISNKNRLESEDSNDNFFRTYERQLDYNTSENNKPKNHNTGSCKTFVEFLNTETVEKLFEEVDTFMNGDNSDQLKAFELLEKNKEKYCDNANFLWRLAQAHELKAKICDSNDSESKKKIISSGISYASKAKEKDPTNPDAFKWFAILKGMEIEFLPQLEKVNNALLYEEHLLTALNYKYNDYFLHHKLGRFKYEVANLYYIQKKLASSFNSKFPWYTCDDAIPHLQKSEELKSDYKENKLFLAKCFIGNKDYTTASCWLQAAKEVLPKTQEDVSFDREIDILIDQCKGY